MSKPNYYVTQGIRIYSIDYLINNELTEIDLAHLFDTPSLKYSIIIGMFRFIDNKKRNSDIVKLITKDNKWIFNNEWTEEQFLTFEKQLVQLYKNLYYYGDRKALSMAQNFMVMYGFKVKNNNINLDK